MKKINCNIPQLVKMLLVFFIAVFSFFEIDAQEIIPDSYETIIKLKNGKEFKGKLKGETDSTFTLIVEDIGELTFEKIKILSIDNKVNLSSKVDSKGYVIDYHNSTRSFISPTGYGLRKGQAYYENIYLAFNSFSYGVTDRFSIAFGGEFISLLVGGETPIFYISPRFNLEFGSDKGAFSVGAIYFSVPESNNRGIGLAQVALTLGSRNNNINFGIGAGFNFENNNNDNVLLFSLGTTLRLSKKLSFVTDNFVLSENDFDNDIVVLSAAIRIHFSKPGAALNVGLWRPVEDIGSLLAIPMISATIPLN